MKYYQHLGNCELAIISKPNDESNIISLDNILDWLKFDYDQVFEYPRGVIIGEIKNLYSSIFMELPIHSLFHNSDLIEIYFDKLNYDSRTYWKRIMSLNKYQAYIKNGTLFIHCSYEYYKGDNPRDGIAEFCIEIKKLITILK
ncbi:hypothetical protein SAMN05216480_10940 [Pustulibacterium marinum]|uniref:Uncharacterized protein n=1 Tax=Pustulibacterium marinum TaxID=1224947 RepID=A0A1I7HG69_9FLAO|nr:hypothetical protein [Pustulibacterium marinum]SFU59730.1 hypothetical protein SAMN05216480_10940 [Pustulibacterium marinum]